MPVKIKRRAVIRSALIGGAAGGVALATYRYPGSIRNVYDIADAMNYGVHDLLLRGQPRVREFSRADVALDFPTSGVTSPGDDRYHRVKENGFADWSFTLDGLVDNPLNLSLADLKALPAQTQITLHTCDEGWSAIGAWTGVPLASLLAMAGIREGARYVVFHCMDTQYNQLPYYESIDLLAATHPQTILAYGLNGEALPEKNGAPLRLRIETQIGYKHAKFVERVEVVNSLESIGAGRGGWWEDWNGAVWYAGL
ncbi:MAG: molybdopterin-dependent oxidoreductase [Gammaproteobacteria bacterium]|jgi:DMSO/TMAO reductase YedYZ molybdopterin-dependent catalytic subunit